MTKKDLWLLDLLFYLVLLSLSIIWLITNIAHLLIYEPSLRQPTTTGTIVTSTYIDAPMRDDGYVPNIWFTYNGDGVTHTKSAIEDVNRVVFFDLVEVNELLAGYPVGMEVPVYYREGEAETAVFQSGIGTPFNTTRRHMVYIFWNLVVLAFILYAAIRRSDYRIEHGAGISEVNLYQRILTGFTTIHGTPNYDQEES